MVQDTKLSFTWKHLSFFTLTQPKSYQADLCTLSPMLLSLNASRHSHVRRNPLKLGTLTPSKMRIKQAEENCCMQLTRQRALRLNRESAQTTDLITSASFSHVRHHLSWKRNRQHYISDHVDCDVIIYIR